MDSTFRVRFGQDSYPISRFIVQRAQALGLNRRVIADRLGYRDIGTAHQALDAALTTGTVPAHMRKHLAKALKLDDTILDAVIAATTHQQQHEAGARVIDRERVYVASFRPHLRAETARNRPEPIFIAAVIGTARLRGVELPAETWDVDTDSRNRLVKAAIRGHYREHNGHVPAFGEVVSYLLVTLPGYLMDFGFPFDTDGNPAGPIQTVERLGEATLGVKRGDSRLTGVMRNTAIRAINTGSGRM